MLALKVVPPAFASEPCGGPALNIEIEGMKDRTGRIIAELYPANRDDFLKDRNRLAQEGKMFRRSVARIEPEGPVHVCIKAPSPGTYALIVIHDRDGLDKFSISKDGVGLPIAQSIGASRPRLRQALVAFDSGPRHMRITMQYLKGLSGFVLPARR